MGERGSPLQLLPLCTVPLGLSLLPPRWEAFSSCGEGRGLGEVPSGSEGDGKVLAGTNSALPEQPFPEPAEHPVQTPTLGPDPQLPSPSSQGLAEAARDPLAAARFLPKKARMQLHAPREHLDPIPGMNGSCPPPMIQGRGREFARGAGPQSGEMGRSAVPLTRRRMPPAAGAAHAAACGLVSAVQLYEAEDS